jgi:hypothetical protein
MYFIVRFDVYQLKHLPCYTHTHTQAVEVHNEITKSVVNETTQQNKTVSEAKKDDGNTPSTSKDDKDSRVAAEMDSLLATLEAPIAEVL